MKIHWIINETWRENKCMNQRNKKMTTRDNSTEKVKQNKSIEIWRKTKQRVPDFSGKYHGKLNDESAVKMM